MSGVLGFGQSLASQRSNYEQQLSQHQAAMVNAEITRRRTDDEARVRNAEALLKYQQIQIAQQEANAAATQEKTDAARETLKARALTKLAASESGVAGVSVGRQDIDLAYTQGQKNAAIETTRVSSINQLQSEKTAAYLSAYTQPAYIYTGEAPAWGGYNYLTAGLGGLTGFLGSGGNFSFLSGLGSCRTASSCSPINSRFNSYG